MILSRARAKGSRFLTVAVCLLPFAFTSAVLAQRATREQRVGVSVVDRSNKAVQGLGPSDFTVREDGVAREVLRVEQGDEPMQVMLLVDTSDNMRLMITDIRGGLRAFVRRLFDARPESQVSLMEFGERPLMVADKATAPNLLDRSIDRLNEHSNSGAYLLDAMLDAAKALKQREAPHAAIVVFLRQSSPEFSTPLAETVERALKDARASLWVLLLEDQPAARGSEAQQREMVLGDVTTRTGGMRDVLLDRMGIESHFAQLADLLASQYVVIYGRPESLIPPTRLEVSTTRSGTRALAPRWTGQ